MGLRRIYRALLLSAILLGTALVSQQIVVASPTPTFSIARTVVNHDLAKSQAATSSQGVAVSIPIPGDPEAMAVSPNGEYAYLVYDNSGSLVIVNLKRHGVKSVHLAGAHGRLSDVAISPDGAEVYLTEKFSQCPCGRSFLAVNAITDRASPPIQVDGPSDAVVISPDGRYAYVSESQTLQVVNLATRSLVSTIPLGATFTISDYMAASPSGKTVYVISAPGSIGAQSFDVLFEVVNLSDKKVVKVIDEGDNLPCGLAAAPNGQEVYESYCSLTGNESTSAEDLRVLSTSGNSFTDRIAIPNFSRGIAFSPDSKYAYIAESAARGFSILNTRTNTVVKQIPIGASINFWVLDRLAISPSGKDLYATSYQLFGSDSGNLDVIPLTVASH